MISNSLNKVAKGGEKQHDLQKQLLTQTNNLFIRKEEKNA